MLRSFLILGAFALFAAEAKFVTHGVLTIGGIALLTLGGLLLVDSPIPEMRVHLLTALAVSVPLGIITAFLMTIALKARRNKVVTGAQGLVGETGVAQTALTPQGKVFVHGELWDAIASSPLPAGQLVTVRRVDGAHPASGSARNRGAAGQRCSGSPIAEQNQVGVIPSGAVLQAKRGISRRSYTRVKTKLHGDRAVTTTDGPERAPATAIRSTCSPAECNPSIVVAGSFPVAGKMPTARFFPVSLPDAVRDRRA